MKKLFLIALLFSLFLSPTFVSADAISDIQARIRELQAQLDILLASPHSTPPVHSPITLTSVIKNNNDTKKTSVQFVVLFETPPVTSSIELSCPLGVVGKFGARDGCLVKIPLGNFRKPLVTFTNTNTEAKDIVATVKTYNRAGGVLESQSVTVSIPGTSTVSNPESIIVSSPVASTVYTTGTTMQIKWNASNVSGSVNLILLDPRAGWSSYVIARNIPASQGSYSWLIPKTGAWFGNGHFLGGGSHLQIRVTPYPILHDYADWVPLKETADKVVHGDSEAFAINGIPESVTNPSPSSSLISLSGIFITSDKISVTYSKSLDSCLALYTEANIKIPGTDILCTSGTNITTSVPLLDTGIVAGARLKLCRDVNTAVCSGLVMIDKVTVATITPTNHAPVGEITRSSSDYQISGWVCDADTPDKAVTVKFYDSDAKSVYVGAIDTTYLPGPAVIAPSCGGSSAHYFTYLLGPSFRIPGYTVYAYAFDTTTGIESSSAFSRRTVAEPVLVSYLDPVITTITPTNTEVTLNPSTNVKGLVYGLVGTTEPKSTIIGWACDPDTIGKINNKVRIKVYTDTTKTTEIGANVVNLADNNRPDVPASCGTEVNHDFVITPPVSPINYRTKGQTYAVYAVDMNTGDEVLLKTFGGNSITTVASAESSRDSELASILEALKLLLLQLK